MLPVDCSSFPPQFYDLLFIFKNHLHQPNCTVCYGSHLLGPITHASIGLSHFYIQVISVTCSRSCYTDLFCQPSLVSTSFNSLFSPPWSFISIAQPICLQLMSSCTCRLFLLDQKFLENTLSHPLDIIYHSVFLTNDFFPYQISSSACLISQATKPQGAKENIS